jgi:nitrile hydratase subunit alpha
MSDHEHDHSHDEEERGIALRVKALERVLVEKGAVDPAALDQFVDAYETKIGPRNGARVVAKAWTEPDYKERLLSDGASAIGELGFSGLQGEHLRVVENTDDTHNVVVCTLCSCYPWPVLGLPPVWYKSPPYRSRIVREPRTVLSEFGLELPDTINIRVWDSSADIRYMVLPQRPAATENLSADALADLVTRDGMIGTAQI